jgi:hypothetical protein
MNRVLGSVCLLFAVSGCGGNGTWFDSAAYTGSVKVEITELTIGRVMLTDSLGQSPEKAKVATFNVSLRITNQSGSNELEYRSWGFLSSTGKKQNLKLVDESGNTYACRNNYATPIEKGVALKVRVPPGQFVEDVLTFEVPPKKAGELKLTLPADFVGEIDDILFRIPRGAIRTVP